MSDDVIIIGAVVVAVVIYIGYKNGTVQGAAASQANLNALDGSAFLSSIF